MDNQKPSVAILKKFALRYFTKQTLLDIRWKKMDAAGMADYKSKVIYLHPDLKESYNTFGCRVGHGMDYFPATKMKLSKWESYFATLLHEIGHFKFRKWKIPKKWPRIRNKIRREYPGNIEMQTYVAEDYHDDFANEMEIEDFKHYIVGGAECVPSLHMRVEEWAIREFKKQRKAINLLFKNK